MFLRVSKKHSKMIWGKISLRALCEVGYGTTELGYGARVGIGMLRGDSKICLKRPLMPIRPLVSRKQY